jgi:hypothetical protein
MRRLTPSRALRLAPSITALVLGLLVPSRTAHAADTWTCCIITFPDGSGGACVTTYGPPDPNLGPLCINGYGGHFEESKMCGQGLPSVCVTCPPPDGGPDANVPEGGSPEGGLRDGGLPDGNAPEAGLEDITTLCFGNPSDCAAVQTAFEQAPPPPPPSIPAVPAFEVCLLALGLGAFALLAGRREA